MDITASSLLLCDLVWEDPSSRNLTLLGVFTSLRADRFPTPGRTVFVYTLLQGPPRAQVSLMLEGISETTGTRFFTSSGIAEIGEYGSRHIRFRIEQLQFPVPGRYNFQLRIDEEVIAETTLQVSR